MFVTGTDSRPGKRELVLVSSGHECCTEGWMAGWRWLASQPHSRRSPGIQTPQNSLESPRSSLPRPSHLRAGKNPLKSPEIPEIPEIRPLPYPKPLPPGKGPRQSPPPPSSPAPAPPNASPLLPPCVVSCFVLSLRSSWCFRSSGHGNRGWRAGRLPQRDSAKSLLHSQL